MVLLWFINVALDLVCHAYIKYVTYRPFVERIICIGSISTTDYGLLSSVDSNNYLQWYYGETALKEYQQRHLVTKEDARKMLFFTRWRNED